MTIKTPYDSPLDAPSLLLSREERLLVQGAYRRGYADALTSVQPQLEAGKKLAWAVRQIQQWLMDNGPIVNDEIAHPLLVKANNLAVKALAAYDATLEGVER